MCHFCQLTLPQAMLGIYALVALCHAAMLCLASILPHHSLQCTVLLPLVPMCHLALSPGGNECCRHGVNMMCEAAMWIALTVADGINAKLKAAVGVERAQLECLAGAHRRAICRSMQASMSRLMTASLPGLFARSNGTLPCSVKYRFEVGLPQAVRAKLVGHVTKVCRTRTCKIVWHDSWHT